MPVCDAIQADALRARPIGIIEKNVTTDNEAQCSAVNVNKSIINGEYVFRGLLSFSILQQIASKQLDVSRLTRNTVRLPRVTRARLSQHSTPDTPT